MPMEPTKVFLSWSGAFSRRIAEVLRDWLPSVVPMTRPFMSQLDISMGARWEAEITTELASTNVGVLVLTPDNAQSPWVHFEAGALAKLTTSRLYPLLFGMEHSLLSPPLARFQAARFLRDEMWLFVKSLNAHCHELAVDQVVLHRWFRACWSSFLQRKVAPIVEEMRAQGGHSEAVAQNCVPDGQVAEETLAIARRVLHHLENAGACKPEDLQGRGPTDYVAALRRILNRPKLQTNLRSREWHALRRILCEWESQRTTPEKTSEFLPDYMVVPPRRTWKGDFAHRFGEAPIAWVEHFLSKETDDDRERIQKMAHEALSDPEYHQFALLVQAARQSGAPQPQQDNKDDGG